MDGICHKCEQPLNPGDKIKLLVYAEWIPLKSRVAFSITKPYDCESETLEHLNCPQQMS